MLIGVFIRLIFRIGELSDKQSFFAIFVPNNLFPVFYTKREYDYYCLIGIACGDVEISEQEECDVTICKSAMSTFSSCLFFQEEMDERAQKLSNLSVLELDSGEHIENDGNEGVWISLLLGFLAIQL